MADHYEILGVSKDATEQDIKRAYRSKANTTHPDKGGDARDFAELAKTYEVLKDTNRKLLYDATGHDQRQISFDAEVQQELLNAFNRVLDIDEDVAVVASVRLGFASGSASLDQMWEGLSARRKKLRATRATITTTNLVNIAHLIIDTELKQIKQGLLTVRHKKRILKAVFKALDAYEEALDPPETVEPPMPSIYFR